ncbi:MAG: SusC/RagA family TonB-linked outer membrane protein [Cyclobacteriaceae bacterium]|nr:SusC/RagA family TonB-linked outer membrane protein [Cyclobacteriaceae bacterium]
MTKIQQIFTACIALLFLAYLPTRSQEIAHRSNAGEHIYQEDNAKMIPLSKVLSDLEAQHGIHVNYKGSLIQDKYADIRILEGSKEKVEKKLKSLLLKWNLEFGEISHSNYVIYTNQEKKELKKMKRSTSSFEAQQPVHEQNNASELEQRIQLIRGASKDITVAGIVTSQEDNGPLPGVNVLVKGTTIGTITNADGAYSLSVPDVNNTLIFSFIGYVSEEIAINGRSEINISLASDITQLGEVVVVGYGTKKKADVIGSISTISSKEIQQTPYASFDASLQGHAAGVQVVSAGGTPGAQSRILIRGTNSLSLNTEPLFIVDGMPISTQTLGIGGVGSATLSPLATINPNDIMSIEVLKDAAATSIYGSRGSNGVILITTKSGESGKGNIEFSVSTGISNLSRKPEDIGFTTSAQYFDLMDQARSNSGLTPMTPGDIINTWPFKTPGDTLTRQEAENTNVNWFDRIMQQGSYQDYNISITTGSEKVKTFASMNYRTDKGMLINNSLQRYSLRINSELIPVKNVTAGFRLALSHSDNDRAKDNNSGSSSGTNGNGGGFSQLNWNVMPWFLVHSTNDPTGYWNARSGFNPAASLDPLLVRDEEKSYRGLGGLYLQYNLPWVTGLSVRTELAADIIQSNSWNSIDRSLRNDDRSLYKKQVERSIILIIISMLIMISQKGFIV